MQIPDLDLWHRASDAVAAVGLDLNSLLSGAVGALLVFLLTSWRDNRKARQLREREREGLMRLVDVEVYQNITALEMIRDDPDIGEQYRAYSELHTAHWQESRVRLTQLLPPSHTGILVKYYGLLEKIGVNLGDVSPQTSKQQGRKPDIKRKRAIVQAKRENLLSVLAREALDIGEKARQMGLVFLGEAPDYFALYGDEKQQISEAGSEEERNAG